VRAFAVPSIVVHAGTCSCPASPQMERASATSSLQHSLSNQVNKSPNFTFFARVAYMCASFDLFTHDIHFTRMRETEFVKFLHLNFSPVNLSFCCCDFIDEKQSRVIA
jgi:hypothetical protein